MKDAWSWDYGQDTVGYTTGFAVELNQPKWAFRYGFFQMPRDKNGFAGDDQFLKWPQDGAYGPFLHSWAMMAEWERRYRINAHPGAIRFLSWLDEAHFHLTFNGRAVEHTRAEFAPNLRSWTQEPPVESYFASAALAIVQ